MRLRLLTAGLLLLRAAGGTAEEAAAAAAAAKEGGSVDGGGGGGGGSFGGVSSSSGFSGGGGGGRSYNTRSSSSGAGGQAAAEENSEESLRLSRQARLKLLRRACGTLRELDALEESLKARRSGNGGGGGGSGGSGSRAGKRGPGASLADGSLEADGDRALRAHIVETCVSIMEEMFIPRAYMAAGGGVGGGADGADWQGEDRVAGGGGMGPEVERIVREEKVLLHVHVDTHPCTVCVFPVVSRLTNCFACSLRVFRLSLFRFFLFLVALSVCAFSFHPRFWGAKAGAI